MVKVLNEYYTEPGFPWGKREVKCYGCMTVKMPALFSKG